MKTRRTVQTNKRTVEHERSQIGSINRVYGVVAHIESKIEKLTITTTSSKERTSVTHQFI